MYCVVVLYVYFVKDVTKQSFRIKKINACVCITQFYSNTHDP